MVGRAAFVFVMTGMAAPAAAQMDASSALPALQPIVREEIPVPGFLAPNDAKAEDYRVEWIGPAIPGVELEIESGSLQWVRVDGVIRVPRARLEVRAKGIEGGTVSAAGFTQTLARGADEPDYGATPVPSPTPLEDGTIPPTPTPAPVNTTDGKGRILMPLVSGGGNPIDVTVMRGGKEVKGKAAVRFAPRKAGGQRIHVDTTCSGFAVRVEEAKSGDDDEWMYVGCRNVTARSTEHRTSSLEIVVFWDNVGQVILVDGVEQDAGGDSIWNLRASSTPGFVALQAGDHKVTIRYALSSWPHKGNLGIGIGPYFDTFQGTGNDDRETFEPVVTVYGSYALSPFSRLVMFNATPMRADTYSDTGFYLQKRTSEALDRRVVGNVFLGGHFLAFTAEDPFADPGDRDKKRIFFRFGAPQGVEFTVRDVGGQGRNVVAGILSNAAIGGTAYYNGWLRYGNAGAFVELNYIQWKELIANPEDEEDTRDVVLRSIGISFGFPLFKFL